MHPALSVIIFTTLSGAGYGLFGLLCYFVLFHNNTITSHISAITFVSGLLATVGLISSLFHLGHPKRAWRAFSQWRTSWLSREGCLALLINVPMAFLFFDLWIGLPSIVINIAAAAGLVLAILTVYATSMIYRSIKAVPSWATPLVPLNYLLLAAASGAILFSFFSGIIAQLNTHTFTPMLSTDIIMAILLVCAVAKLLYWYYIDTLIPLETIQSATGLKGDVKVLERPHSGENYLTHEMGFRAARKTCVQRRVLSLLLGFIVPGILVILHLGTPGYSVAVISCLAGFGFERWLFFAEARHTTMLYYGGSMK